VYDEELHFVLLAILLLLSSVMQLPEDLKSRCPVKERPWSFLYYSRGQTIEVPNLREDFEVHLATDVAFGLQPMQLDVTTAVARLRSKLRVCNGQYVLSAAEKRSDQSKRHLLHWGAVELGRFLSALQEKGMVCSFVDDDEHTILITSPGEAMVKITSDSTRIYCDDEKISQHIYDALGNVCNGI
jgi:integrator complex subunit 9